MKGKLKVWFWRYLPAEVVGTLCAVVFPVFISSFSKNILVIALAGTWGENIGFYGTMVAREFIHTRTFTKSVRNIFLEFGVAEAADSFFIRPACMYFMLSLFSSLPLGILVGKVAADLIFYIPAIISFELRKKYLRD